MASIETKDVEKEVVAKPETTLGIRHVTVFLLFLATSVSYATRVSMSIAIVAMTTNTDNNTMTFDWDKSTQDTILSSFFWGYIILQIPAGIFAGQFGGKYFMLAGMILTGVANMLVPIAAYHGGWVAVCACRIVMGITQGLIFPSIHGLLSLWSPVSERSRMGTFIYAGSQLGTIIEMMMAGVLAESSWGWPSIYYVAGLTCLVWSALWLILGSSSPTTSRWISKEERKYIENTAGAIDISNHENRPVPWRAIFTSLPFWAIILAHSGQSFGFWTLLTEMPSYMHEVLGVQIKSGGFLSALPYAAMYILSFIFSWLADFIVNKNYVQIGTSRKIFNSIAFWGPAVTLLGLCYLPPGHLNLAVGLLVITVGLNGAHYVGFLISHIDLSPNFASTLMGITNCCGNIFSIMAPLSVGAVVKDETSAADWRNVFYIAIAFYFLSNMFYILFMSGKVQPWNDFQKDTGVEDGVKKTNKMESNSAMAEAKL